MKRVIPIIALMLLVVACTTTQRRVSINTLANVGDSVNASMKAYLDLVVSGAVDKNTLPRVSRAYDDFQQAYRAALTAAQLNSNAVPTDELIGKAVAFATLTQQKGTK